MSNLPPPPTPPRHAGRRSDTKSTTVYTDNTPAPTGEKPSWKDGLKAKGKVWGSVALEKSIKLSDQFGAKVNNYAEKTGNERFWPTTGDFPQEIDKCARILRAFTVEGIPTEVVPEVENEAEDVPKKKAKKPVKLLRKIPAKVIQEAVGLAIFTNFRTAIAPFGGSGGSGMVMARLPDGSWSAPSSISPNNYAAGLVYGVDIFDAVVVIRTQKALETFYGHKATLGADIGVVAGPFGAGAVVESGKERAPVYSYVKSRGLYAGISILGQVFVERFDENAAMYHWPGVKAQDILTGKVRVPREAAGLMEALKDAETGKAQLQKGDGLEYVEPSSVDQLDLHEGEVLKLPPTPDMVDPDWGNDDPHATEIRRMSGSNTPNRVVPANQDVKRAVPPPLPARFQSNASSVSTYSTAEDGEVSVSQPAPASGFPTSDMDESERREYEQYQEMLKQDEIENRRLQEGQYASASDPMIAVGSQPPAYANNLNEAPGSAQQDLEYHMERMAVTVNPADGRILESTDEPAKLGHDKQQQGMYEKQADLR